MLLVGGKFIFLYADMWFDVTKCKSIAKYSSLKFWLYFHLFLQRTQKLIFVYNFEAPFILQTWTFVNLDYQRLLEYRRISEMSMMKCFATIICDIQPSNIVGKLSILGICGDLGYSSEFSFISVLLICTCKIKEQFNKVMINSLLYTWYSTNIQL